MNFNRIIKWSLGVAILLFLFSLIQRIPHDDDAWLGEHAYWQAKLGYVKSELMRGITNQETYVICHHKLLTLQGAMLISVFGFSVYTLKSLSLLYLILFLFLFYYYTCNKLFDKNFFYLALLLFLTNGLIFEFSFVYRPELPVMTMGFASYIFLDKILGDQKKHYLFPVLSGIFAGLCVATHLNGVIFAVAGFLLLLWNRRYLQGLIFGISSIPAMLIYFYDFTGEYNINYWIYQIRESPMLERASDGNPVVDLIVRVATEHIRFFHSLPEISFSLLWIVLMVITFNHLKPYRNMMRYLFLLMFFLALLSVHKTSKYIIVYLPYLVILLTLSLKIILDKNNRDKVVFRKVTFGKIKPFLIGLAVIYLLANTAENVLIASHKWSSEKNRRIVSEYIIKKPDSCRIVAPMSFVFNEILRFNSIQSQLVYSEMQKADKSIHGSGFLTHARSFNIDYIFLTDSYIEKLGMDTISDREISNSGYQLLYRSNLRLILRNIEKQDPPFGAN